MRWSKTFIPTLREIPSEAEVASHQLMLRAGLMRKLATGLYSYLPLGWRLIRKVEQIIREEMDRAGALEVCMPILQPLELWEKSGREKDMGPELMRLFDRSNRPFVLGPTHEEIITDLVAGEIRSYRQLPLNFYQITTKIRDEIRPRFGVMRAREFIMKDAYSFDIDEENAHISYQKMYDAYKRIFERCKLQTVVVEAETGAMGGTFSHEFIVPANVGESEMALCSNCGYAANLEKATSAIDESEWSEADFKEAEKHPYSPVDTPNMRTIEEVSNFLGVQPKQLVKTLIYETDAGPVAVLIRGDHEINETKLKKVLNCRDLNLASAEVIERVSNAPVGFAGPIGLSGKIKIVADKMVMVMPYMVTGANRADTHFIYVVPGRDFIPDEVADIRVVKNNDLCPKCKALLKVQSGIEVGHLFKLGTKYSAAFNATYLDASGKKRLLIMGCYGIGVTRTAAAIIEIHHDEFGIKFPYSVAPYHIYLMVVNPSNSFLVESAERFYSDLANKGYEILYDDRDDRPGVKFKDADLIGVPIRIVLGERFSKERKIEVKIRATGQIYNFHENELIEKLAKIIEELK